MKRFLPLCFLVLAVACQERSNPTDLTDQSPSSASINPPGLDEHSFIITLRERENPLTVAHDYGVEPTFVYTEVLSGFAGSISDAARSGLLRDSRVMRIEADQLISADDTQTSATWGLDRVDQRALPLDVTYHYAYAGRGVTVYVLDTGIRYSHVEFGGRARLGYDVYGGDGSDCHSHGTHVAGTAAGATYGLAKQANIVSVRVLDCTGSGTVSGAIAGLDWVAANGPRPGVANMSLSAGASPTLDDAVERLFQKGIVTAVAAANNGADACNYSPSRAPNAITVGATDKTDTRASWSNFGSCVDLFAPGVGIVSASYGSDTGTATKSGTSMASPHAAGAAAIYLEEYPSASPGQVRNALYSWSTKGIVKSSNSANNHLLFTVDPGTTGGPNAAPYASFQVSCNELSCSFQDASTDGDGYLTGWAWDFGDGSSANTQGAAHTYAAAGTYNVQLVVTDDAGATATTTKSLTVTKPPISLAAAGYKAKGKPFVDLSWTGATTSSVRVLRNGSLIATVANSGYYKDALSFRGSATLKYKVCEVGTTVCSAEKTVVF